MKTIEDTNLVRIHGGAGQSYPVGQVVKNGDGGWDQAFYDPALQRQVYMTTSPSGLVSFR
jgi:hypothetical protein